MVAGVWSQIVSKVRSSRWERAESLNAIYQGVALDVEAVRRETFGRQYDSATPNLAVFEVSIYSYSGEDQLYWARSKQGERFLHL